MTYDEMKTTWERYVTMWRPSSGDDKHATASDVLAAECVYTDPAAQRRGQESLIGYMLEFHAGYPGCHFVTTRFIAHHERSIALWNMVDGEGNVLSDGVSYGEFDEGGRLRTMTGFFEPPTA